MGRTAGYPLNEGLRAEVEVAEGQVNVSLRAKHFPGALSMTVLWQADDNRPLEVRKCGSDYVVNAAHVDDALASVEAFLRLNFGVSEFDWNDISLHNIERIGSHRDNNWMVDAQRKINDPVYR